MTYIQYVHTVKTIQSLPPNVQKTVLRHIDSDFIRFLVECIVNLLHGNFITARKTRFVSHRFILEKIVKKNINRSQQRSLLISSRGIALLRAISPLIVNKFGK